MPRNYNNFDDKVKNTIHLFQKRPLLTYLGTKVLFSRLWGKNIDKKLAEILIFLAKSNLLLNDSNYDHNLAALVMGNRLNAANVLNFFYVIWEEREQVINGLYEEVELLEDGIKGFVNGQGEKKKLAKAQLLLLQKQQEISLQEEFLKKYKKFLIIYEQYANKGKKDLGLPRTFLVNQSKARNDFARKYFYKDSFEQDHLFDISKSKYIKIFDNNSPRIAEYTAKKREQKWYKKIASFLSWFFTLLMTIGESIIPAVAVSLAGVSLPVVLITALTAFVINIVLLRGSSYTLLKDLFTGKFYTDKNNYSQVSQKKRWILDLSLLFCISGGMVFGFLSYGTIIFLLASLSLAPVIGIVIATVIASATAIATAALFYKGFFTLIKDGLSGVKNFWQQNFVLPYQAGFWLVLTSNIFASLLTIAASLVTVLMLVPFFKASSIDAIYKISDVMMRTSNTLITALAILATIPQTIFMLPPIYNFAQVVGDLVKGFVKFCLPTALGKEYRQACMESFTELGLRGFISWKNKLSRMVLSMSAIFNAYGQGRMLADSSAVRNVFPGSTAWIQATLVVGGANSYIPNREASNELMADCPKITENTNVGLLFFARNEANRNNSDKELSISRVFK